MITREFDVPRTRVFDAWTKPELLKRWFGGIFGWSPRLCEVDLKVGGTWRLVLRRQNDGMEMVQRGVYREIVPPERLVLTWTWDIPGEEADGGLLVTTVLVEDRGRTALTSTMLYDSRESRDANINVGVEREFARQFDRLAECLASIA